MIAVTTASRIEGYQVRAYKGTAQGATFEELMRSAESLEANAVLNTCYDNALDVDTLFHGTAVLIEPINVPIEEVPGSKRGALILASLGSIDERNDQTGP